MIISSHHRFSRPFSGFPLALAFLIPVLAPSAELKDEPAMSAGIMMEHCKEMQKEKQQLKSDMKDQDAALDEQIAILKSASEDEKIADLTSIVTLLSAQRSAMDARIAKMDDDMMRHMMQHMQMGKESMAGCPMMKGMSGMDGMVEKDEDHGKVQK